MLEKPDIKNKKIIACLQDDYELLVDNLTFLPLGADLNTAVYRAVTEDGMQYFVKLRRGEFDETSVVLPKFLGDQGIAQIIAPLTTKAGRLWGIVEAFKLILYPFIEGRDGYEVDLSDRHWLEFGSALKQIHTTAFPSSLTSRIQCETYTPKWREIVKKFLASIEDDIYDDPAAAELAVFLKTKRNEVINLVNNAQRLALILQSRPGELVVCHSDIHAGNILVGSNNSLYIVDWDNPVLALKERDLMFIGGAQGFTGHTLQEEEILFYRGYGRVDIDPVALAYYRYERIVQDIAVYCEQLFLSNEGGEDREQALAYLESNFLPGHTIDIAYNSDKTLGGG